MNTRKANNTLYRKLYDIRRTEMRVSKPRLFLQAGVLLVFILLTLDVFIMRGCQ